MFDKWALLARTWREKQVQCIWLHSLRDENISFWKTTQDILDWTLPSLNIYDLDLRKNLLKVYLQLGGDLNFFEMLTAFKKAGLETTIISNGSPETLSSAVSNTGENDVLGHVLSVEKIGIFKPNSKIYQMATRRLSITKKPIFFISSNIWGAFGAENYSLQVGWINRFYQAKKGHRGHHEHKIIKLSELPTFFGFKTC